MNDAQIKELIKLDLKERLLSKIIVWLRTKGLLEECLQAVDPELLKGKI